MNSRVLGVLKIFLWLIAAFHLIVGLGLNVSADFPQVMADYYGAQVNWTPEFLYIVKPIGAFMFALGVMAAYAARDPLNHVSTIYGFVVLFAFRGLQRLIFQGEIETAVQIASGRNTGNAIFFLLMAVALVVLLRLAAKPAEASS
jgi:hypothetical protein